MQERLNQIWKSILEFWNKYSKKQKTIVISVIAVIIIAITILAVVLSRTTYVSLIKCDDTKSASEVVDLLEAEGIASELDSDFVTVMVDEKSYNDAVIVIGKNEVNNTEFSYEDALNNSISTTESEKQLKTTLALQSEVRQKLMLIDGVKDATVFINKPEDDYTILAEQQNTSVSVMLSLSSESNLSAQNSESIASFLATIVGNSSTDQITIIDDKGNLLFGGETESLLGGTVSSVYEYKQKLTNNIINNVKQVLLKYGTYNDVEVGASNIKFDMDKVTELYTEYTPAEGSDQGVYSSSYTYKSEGTTESSGTPGTDANDGDTTYEVETGSGSGSKVETNKYEYKPNERTVNTEYEVGAVVPNESSMGIVLTTYKVYKEEDLEKQGLLNGTTWEEFMTENETKVQEEVSDDVYETISSTTGISTDNLHITAWVQPIFQPKESSDFDFTKIFMIVLAVLILALLIFVVFKSTKPVEVTETEPEISVEELLETTKENQDLDELEFNEKSETRKLIEKFVDDNPEAVALLLRNWLNDDRG